MSTTTTSCCHCWHPPLLPIHRLSFAAQPCSLMEICRRDCRRQLGINRLNRVDELRIPPTLKHYLLYEWSVATCVAVVYSYIFLSTLLPSLSPSFPSNTGFPLPNTFVWLNHHIPPVPWPSTCSVTISPSQPFFCCCCCSRHVTGPLLIHVLSYLTLFNKFQCFSTPFNNSSYSLSSPHLVCSVKTISIGPFWYSATPRTRCIEVVDIVPF